MIFVRYQVRFSEENRLNLLSLDSKIHSTPLVNAQNIPTWTELQNGQINGLISCNKAIFKYKVLVTYYFVSDGLGEA